MKKPLAIVAVCLCILLSAFSCTQAGDIILKYMPARLIMINEGGAIMRIFDLTSDGKLEIMYGVRAVKTGDGEYYDDPFEPWDIEMSPGEYYDMLEKREMEPVSEEGGHDFSGTAIDIFDDVDYKGNSFAHILESKRVQLNRNDLEEVQRMLNKLAEYNGREMPMRYSTAETATAIVIVNGFEYKFYVEECSDPLLTGLVDSLLRYDGQKNHIDFESYNAFPGPSYSFSDIGGLGT